MRRTLILIGIIANLLLIVDFALCFLSANFGWNIERYIFASQEALSIISILLLISIIQFFYNLRFCNHHNLDYTRVLLIGTLIVNPIISILLLRRKLHVDLQWYKNPIFINIRYIIYRVCIVLNISFFLIIALCSIFSIPDSITTPLVLISFFGTCYVMLTNYHIAKIHEEPLIYLGVVLGGPFYSPFYARKVLKKNWLEKKAEKSENSQKHV